MDHLLLRGTRLARLPLIGCMAVFAAPAEAQEVSVEEIAELRAELRTLRAEQAKQRKGMLRTQRQIDAIDRRLAAIAGDQWNPEPGTGLSGAPVQAAAAMADAGNPSAVAAAKLPPSSDEWLSVSGDLRLRYEDNWGQEGARDRGRGALRARLRAQYAVTDAFTVGGRLVTGDPDDPNTADVTLSSFADDLTVSLDQAYLRGRFGGLTVWGGKFPNPFERTDLVWDGDVSPQGLAATYQGSAGVFDYRLAGLYFAIDEDSAGPDADMAGGQVMLGAQLAPQLRAEVSGAYYDYSLRGVPGADAGDFRSNLLAPDGSYLSDFNLIDGIAALTYSGLGERMPLRIAGEYVRNLGAATDADTGYTASLALGRTSRRNDWKFGYQYMVAETDAVFAAFSHDNLGLATNYRLHALSVDFVPLDHIGLNATYYLYRQLDPLGPGGSLPGDWRNRLRLNVTAEF